MPDQTMTPEEAIKVIKANWPPERYTMLLEALTMAIEALEEEEDRYNWGNRPDARDVIGEESCQTKS